MRSRSGAAHRHRHGARGDRRGTCRGRGDGADRRRRDARSCRSAPKRSKGRRRGCGRDHPSTGRRIVRLPRPRALAGGRLGGTVRAWQVIGPSSIESRFEGLRAGTTPLVGREEELDLLLRRWRQAQAGDGSVVLVSGEPGIGKSRIAVALMERLSDEPHSRLRSFCSPHHQDTALYPTITQLERAAGFRRDDTDEQRLDRLEAVLAQATTGVSEAVPLLAALLSLPTDGRYPPLNLTPQKRKERTLK